MATGFEACPQCEGKVRDGFAIVCSRDECRQTALPPCGLCHGVGHVAIEIADRYWEGQQLRAYRMHKLDMGPVEFAEMFGLDFIQVNQMEWGREPIPAWLKREVGISHSRV